MKTLPQRAWLALFPIPNVSAMEAFLMRAFLAATILRFLPVSIGESSQPFPVGLAHFFNLTWLSQPNTYLTYKLVVMAACLLYASGAALRVSLPLLTVLQVLPYTLLNSQGHMHHSYQIISLTLLGMAVVSLAHGQRSPGVRQWALLGVLLAVGVGLLQWYLVGGGGTAMTKWLAGFIGKDSADWAFTFGRFGVVTLVAWPLAKVAAAPDKSSAPSPALNAALLMAGQFMIAGAYLVSVCSKLLNSKGQWLLKSHYIALDFVKTTRQSYYSTLDPKFTHYPSSVEFLLAHETLARLFFGGGVVLETILIIAVGTRWLSLVFGICLVFMHATIQMLMTLAFPTNEYMDTLFFVNVPFLIALVVVKIFPRSCPPSPSPTPSPPSSASTP